MPGDRPFERYDDPGTGSDRVSGEYESAVLALLLQKHDASQRDRLVLGVIGRLMSAAAVIYLGVVSDLSITRLGSGLLVAILVAASWQWGRHRITRQIVSIEETLSRMAGGSAEQAYIESRFIAEGGVGPREMLLRGEPVVWLAASVAVVLISLIAHGLTI